MKLPSLEPFKYHKEVRTVYVLELPNTRMRGGVVRQSCASLWTLSKAIAKEFIERQAGKHRRCVCGRRDIFCRYYNGPHRSERLKACAQRKTRRMERIGSWVYKRLKKREK